MISDTVDWDTRAQTLLNTYKAAQLRKQGALMNFWSRQVVRTPSQQQQPPSEQVEQLQSIVRQEIVEDVNHVLQDDISTIDSNGFILRQSGNFKL